MADPARDARRREQPSVTWLGADTAEAAAERAAVGAGRLPARYGEPWADAFLAEIAPHLRPGIRILDVGCGARATLAPERRPPGCTYAGLDVSADELARAGDGVYQETIVGDVSTALPGLTGRFDLVISWQALEHVASMRGALATQRDALVPGGTMVAMLSGARAVFALAARAMPYRAGTALQARLLGVAPQDKFPTRYDGCTDRALRELLHDGGWASWTIVPRYKGAGYLRFSRSLQRAYLVYENWAERSGRRDLATHYIVTAVA
jgi:SAM-dependent methyltransferase